MLPLAVNPLGKKTGLCKYSMKAIKCTIYGSYEKSAIGMFQLGGNLSSWLNLLLYYKMCVSLLPNMLRL